MVTLRRFLALASLSILAGIAFSVGLHTDGAIFLTGALLLFGRQPP